MRTEAPLVVSELELSAPLQGYAWEEGVSQVSLLARLHGQPVGWIGLLRPQSKDGEAAFTPPEELQEIIRRRLGWFLAPKVLLADSTRSLQAPAQLPPISVIVCTRDRTVSLEKTLTALLTLDYPHFEVIVVDNAPSDASTQRLVAGLPATYVCEPQPGLDRARNRGWATARNDLIAFTDDDVRPDRGWLKAIATAFSDPEAMCLTGFVAPAELDTPAQRLFELAYGGMSHGFTRRIIRRETLRPGELLWASGFGVGANMAFRREVFERLGGFDIALDVGTPSGGGGDIEMFYRVVASGMSLVYEPAALVWHTHRREMAGLRRQIFNNGRSFGAYLLTCARSPHFPAQGWLGFMLFDWLGWWLLRRLRHPGRLPFRLVLAELVGALCSPLAYALAVRAARKEVRDHTLATD